MAEVNNLNVFDSDKKFVDFAGLDYFWEKAKEYVDNADYGLSGSINNIETVLGIVGDGESGLIKDVAKLRDDVDALGGTEGGIQGMIDTTIAGLDVEDTAVVGKYVSSVAEVDGKITVSREDLPDWTDTINTAEQNAKDYADTAVATAVGAYTAEGVTASGLRKEIEDKVKEVSDAAKSYSIVKVTEGLSENVKEAFKLVDEDNVQAGETINIYKDSSLKSVALEGQELVFVYILADGKDSDPVKVDVSAFLSESEYGNGLQVVDHIISVKKDETSEAFLSVSEAGVKLSGVQDAIDTAKTNAIDAANDYTDAREIEIDKKWAAADATLKTTLEQYADQAEADAIDAANAYTDDEIVKAKEELNGVIEENERVTAESLNDLDTRVKSLEDHKDDYKAYADQAEADANAYTDALYASIKFATTGDIDTLFEVEQ